MKKCIFKKLICVGMSLTMVGAALVGCSATAEVSGEVVEVVFSNFHEEGASSNMYGILNDAVTRFNEDFEGVYKIVNEQMPQETYETNISTQAAADELPDMFILKGTQSKEYGEMGMLMDLTEPISEWGIDEVLRDGVLDEHSINGSVYGIPYKTESYGYLFYNTEIFAEAGIEEFPQTVDELIAASEKITAAGYTTVALGDKDLWPADSLTFSSFVNKYVGNDWTQEIVDKTGESKFTDEEFIAALTDFQKLGTSGVFNSNYSSIDNDEALQLYMNGEAAIKSAGEWENTTLNNTAPEIAEVTEIAFWPGSGTDNAIDSVEQSSAWGMALNSNLTDEQKECAMEFLTNYVITDEWGQASLEENNVTPAWEVTEYDESTLNPISAKLIAASEEAVGCANWDVVLTVSVKTVYQRGLQELLLGQTTPEELGADMQEAFELDL
ncbi:MAG: extracellular solute-binding protein [Eubacteriales bacterium]